MHILCIFVLGFHVNLHSHCRVVSTLSDRLCLCQAVCVRATSQYDPNLPPPRPSNHVRSVNHHASSSNFSYAAAASATASAHVGRAAEVLQRAGRTNAASVSVPMLIDDINGVTIKVVERTAILGSRLTCAHCATVYNKPANLRRHNTKFANGSCVPLSIKGSRPKRPRAHSPLAPLQAEPLEVPISFM